MLASLLLLALSYCLALCGASALPSPEAQIGPRVSGIERKPDSAEVMAVRVHRTRNLVRSITIIVNEYAGSRAVRQSLCYLSLTDMLYPTDCYQTPRVMPLDENKFTEERLPEFIKETENILFATMNIEKNPMETFQVRLNQFQYDDETESDNPEASISFEFLNSRDKEVIGRFKSSSQLSHKYEDGRIDFVFNGAGSRISPYKYVESHLAGWPFFNMGRENPKEVFSSRNIGV